MAYRPITDVWILARPKLRRGPDGEPNTYYGAYPAGFVERARALLGVTINDPVLHVCAGKVRDYPYLERAVGPRDGTVDLDPDLAPDFLLDVRNMGSSPGDLYPWPDSDGLVAEVRQDQDPGALWAGALVDRPYTAEDAMNYVPGAEALPDPNDLLKRSLSVVRPGGRVGFLDHYIPRPPKKVKGCDIKFVACIGVTVGFGNRMRAFTVFERVASNALLEHEPEAKSVPGTPQNPGDLPGTATVIMGGRHVAGPASTAPPPSDEPLTEPTPEQVEFVQRVVDGAELRKRLCRICWGKRDYPLPGDDVQPLPEAKCDGCGLKATLMPVSLLAPDREPEPTPEPEPVPEAADPMLDGF